MFERVDDNFIVLYTNRSVYIQVPQRFNQESSTEYVYPYKLGNSRGKFYLFFFFRCLSTVLECRDVLVNVSWPEGCRSTAYPTGTVDKRIITLSLGTVLNDFPKNLLRIFRGFVSFDKTKNRNFPFVLYHIYMK